MESELPSVELFAEHAHLITRGAPAMAVAGNLTHYRSATPNRSGTSSPIRASF